VIVVLDGGGRELDEQSRVLSAMERFCPMARVWVYEEGANPPLRGFVDRTKKVVAPESVGEARIVEKPGSVSRPALRISGSNGTGHGVGHGVGHGAGQGHRKALRTSDVLDQDELAALLKPSDKD
jgi:hypothetical protein